MTTKENLVSKKVASIYRVATWTFKFSPEQAKSIWKMFCIKRNQNGPYEVMKEIDFLDAAESGHLRIEKKLESDPKKQCILFFVDEPGYFRIGRGRLTNRSGDDLKGELILRICDSIFYERGDKINACPMISHFFSNTQVSAGETYTTWVEKELGLVVRFK